MFNVTVLKLKDILKYLSIIILIGIVIISVNKKIGANANIINKDDKKENNIISKIESKIKIFSENNMLQALDTTMPVISNINKEYKKDEKENNNNNKNILKQMLETQISSIKGIGDIEKNKSAIESKETQNEDNQEQTNNGEIAEAGTKTEIITKNPISDGSNTQIGNVKIKNQTEYQITEELLTQDIQMENKNIILFHTHSCESYTASEKYPYTPTGNFRTTDLNFTVTRVGTELETYLKKYNYNVVHNTDYHDYPAYNGSYTRSLKTVENILKTTPSDIIIDIHRDAIGSRSDYAPTVKIENEEAAQLMFVIGTDNGGLWHPNWKENLKFALKIQQKAEEMYPGLFKTMMLTKSRYNQHTGKYASIIEVGATGNTLDQCLVSMKYLAEVMHEVIK